MSPPFQSGIAEQARTLNAVFSEPETISMLAPGRRILYTFDRAPDYDAAKRTEKYTMAATYNDLPALYSRSWRSRGRRTLVTYVDTYVLDFRQWSQATTETDYDSMNWNIAKRQEKRTEKIVAALQMIVARDARAGKEEVVEDIVIQSELTSNEEFEHPVNVPARQPHPVGGDWPEVIVQDRPAATNSGRRKSSSKKSRRNR